MLPHEIKAALQGQLSAFKKGAGDLVEITHEEFTEYDKGTYGVLWAKPSKRLGAALSISRELLVLASNFSDQQVRTIAAAEHCIETAGTGRLEPQVLLILHRDQRGNEKLKNWGRERGLTVLPMYVDSKGLPTGAEFERRIAEEMFSHDPFDVTGPVADEARFYGRRTEAQELARQLQAGQVRSCLGIRKIGKTSVINRVINNAMDHHDCFCVMVDCSLDAVGSSDAGALLAAIAGAAEAATSSPNRYTAVADRGTETLEAATKRLLSTLSRIEHPLIVVFDEVDYITPGSPTVGTWKQNFNPFWRALRAIYQETSRGSKRLSILVGGVSSKWFSVESIDNIENAALQFVPEEFLSPFARAASAAMLRRLGATAGLKFDDAAASIIAAACSDMPFWIRKCCSFIHRQVPIETRPVQLGADQVKSMVSQFIESDGAALAQVALSHLFRVFPEIEPICVGFLDDPTRIQNPSLYRVSVKYGVLALDAGKYSLGAMMNAGLRLHQASARSDQDPQAAPVPPPPLSDWAEDLAVVNKRRNVLERKLRSIILGLIRSDSLHSPGKPTTIERILRAVPESRRKTLAGIAADELVHKLFWLELLELIRKEWPLIERVFGSQAEFETHAKIVNDRPDTHAKTFDLADFALQRRSLTWLEDRVAQV